MQERFALMQPLGNITLLERPLRSITLLTVVRAALRARARQYEVEHYLQETRQAEADKTQAYAREEAAQAQIELLNHVGEILSAELNLDTLLPAIVEAGTDLSGADIGMFFSEGVVEGVRKFALRCVSSLTLAEASSAAGRARAHGRRAILLEENAALFEARRIGHSMPTTRGFKRWPKSCRLETASPCP